jgi:hypothetical protein
LILEQEDDDVATLIDFYFCLEDHCSKHCKAMNPFKSCSELDEFVQECGHEALAKFL